MYSVHQSPFEILSVNDNLYPIFQRYNVESSEAQSLSTLSEHAPFIVQLLEGFENVETLSTQEFEKIETAELVDYLIRSHRYYTEKKIPELRLSLANLAKFDKEYNQGRLVAVSIFENYVDNMLAHFEEEERSLFPLFLLSDEQLCNKWKFSQVHEEKPKHEEVPHVSYFELIEELLTNTNQQHDYFTQVFLRDLCSFKTDLALHEWIEEQVLIPRFRV